jgi:hypothetical protein
VQHEPEVGAELGDQRAVLGTRVRTGRDDHGDRETLEAPGDEGQEPERRTIRPLQVVDGDQQRRLLGDAREEPVQPVQRRGIGIRGRLASERCGLEEPTDEARGAGEDRLAFGVARARTIGSRSWSTTPNEKTCSSSPPRADSDRIPASAARIRAAASRLVFPIPGGPSMTAPPPSPRAAKSITA